MTNKKGIVRGPDKIERKAFYSPVPAKPRKLTADERRRNRDGEWIVTYRTSTNETHLTVIGPKASGRAASMKLNREAAIALATRLLNFAAGRL